MNNITQPFSNSLDDFVDDFTTTVVMKELRDTFAPLKKKIEDGEQSAFNEALSSALTTLQMGLSMYSINIIQNEILPLILKRAMSLYTYIIGGKVVRGIARSLKSRAVPTSVKRRALNLVTDGLADRQQRAKVANDLVTHLDNINLKHRQMANDTKNNLTNSMLNSASSNNKPTLLFAEKTKMGKWTSSREDKRLYEIATGKKLQAGISWVKLSQELNNYSHFAKSAEGKVVNLAQVQLSTLAYNQIDRVN